MNKLIILFILVSATLRAQIPDINSAHKKEVFHWFYMDLKKVYDKETTMNQIIIRNVGSSIISGTFEEFMLDHRQGAKSGKIVIGPFSERYYVEQAQYLYNQIARGAGFSAKETDSEEEEPTYSFFYVQPFFDESSQEIRFELIPSRVTVGTEFEFMAILSEGLNFEKLAIGPFNNYQIAEISKYVFRKNNESGYEQPVDSSKIKSLQIMAAKWKTLKPEIVKKADDKIKRKATYRFHVKFPKLYFVPDVLQVITITASYSDSFETSSSSFTLQGEDVVDNNYVITSKTGTTYINILNFELHRVKKITGFFFESIIYNDTEMIILEPKYYEIK
jgi:hypothetical protein